MDCEADYRTVDSRTGTSGFDNDAASRCYARGTLRRPNSGRLAMLVGHLGVGLIGKRLEPRISLGTWMLAVLLADLVCFPLLIARVEHFRDSVGDIPYSHSLLMNAIWAALFAAAYYLFRRYPRGAWLLFGAVLSHWVLDVISHKPDMQIAPGVETVL